MRYLSCEFTNFIKQSLFTALSYWPLRFHCPTSLLRAEWYVRLYNQVYTVRDSETSIIWPSTGLAEREGSWKFPSPTVSSSLSSSSMSLPHLFSSSLLNAPSLNFPPFPLPTPFPFRFFSFLFPTAPLYKSSWVSGADFSNRQPFQKRGGNCLLGSGSTHHKHWCPKTWPLRGTVACGLTNRHIFHWSDSSTWPVIPQGDNIEESNVLLSTKSADYVRFPKHNIRSTPKFMKGSFLGVLNSLCIVHFATKRHST